MLGDKQDSESISDPEQADYAKLVVDNIRKEIKVSKVKIEGVVHTNFEFLELITRDLLQAKNVGDVIIGSRNIGAKLKKLGIFKSVEIELKANPERDNVLDIVYIVEESPRIYASTGADFGASDTNMNMSINIRNAFGNAEIVSGKSSYGVDSVNELTDKDTLTADKQSSLQLNFRKPLNANPDDNLDFGIYKLHQSHLSIMSYQDTLQGISLARCFAHEYGYYKFGYQGVWRENHGISPNAALSVRWDAGHSLKSSLFHEYSTDSRNDLVFPSNGIFARLYQELAGLGGDVRFLKTEVQGSKSTTLRNAWTLSVSAKFGILLPLQRDTILGPRINDRFILGGPNSLRGFKHGGVGPREKDSFLGGDIYHALGLDLIFPLPKLPSDFIRGHAFINSGKLLRINSSHILKTGSDLISNIPSTSVGIGLVARFAGFRLELNYCLPVIAAPTDRYKTGFQLGLGINFL